MRANKAVAEKLHPIPWTEDAVLLTARWNGEREIVREGSLKAIVEWLFGQTPAARDLYLIALPDRHVAPFGYSTEEIPAVIGRLPRD